MTLKILCLRDFAHFCQKCAKLATTYPFWYPKCSYQYHTKRKISSEFSNGEQIIQYILVIFIKRQRYNLKTLPQLFQVAIHFHPGHPQLKTLTLRSNALV